MAEYHSPGKEAGFLEEQLREGGGGGGRVGPDEMTVEPLVPDSEAVLTGRICHQKPGWRDFP